MTKSLLHVEDKEYWRGIFEDAAGLLKLDLRQYSSGDAALAAIKERVPDIVITDLHLEGSGDQSGYAIARVAREAGVKNVTIASETGSPSQHIEGVVIQSKNEALKWLRGLAGGPERG